jgi:hypothetical protein
MARRTTTKRGKRTRAKSGPRSDALEPRSKKSKTAEDSEVHVLAPGIVCDTEPRGHATPRGRSPLELVVDSTEGFVPLWAKNTTLRWRFRESSMTYFKKPAAAKTEIRKLLGEAILAWGNAVPVKFVENNDVWDFEIVMRKSDDCDDNGCTLAMAFFPDTGRHKLVLYPQMFAYSREEQIETLIHEIGHVFGLRHFFANVSEKEWPSEIFGTHSKFSIMNYGNLSRLTNEDKQDLKRLYTSAWSGTLTKINGTPIRLVKPFHTLAATMDSMVAVGPIQPEVQPQLAPAAFAGN